MLASIIFLEAVVISQETVLRHGSRMRIAFWPSMQVMLRNPLFEKILTIAFVLVVAFSMLEMRYVSFIERCFGLNAIETMLYASCVFTFIGVVLSLVQGVLLRRLVLVFSEATLLKAGISVVLAAMILIPLDSLGVWPFFFFATALAGGGRPLVAPTLLSLVSGLAQGSTLGAAMGCYQSVRSQAGVLGFSLIYLEKTYLNG